MDDVDGGAGELGEDGGALGGLPFEDSRPGARMLDDRLVSTGEGFAAELLDGVAVLAMERDEGSLAPRRAHEVDDRAVVDLEAVGVGQVELERGDAGLHACRDRGLGHRLGVGEVQAPVDCGGLGP